MFFSSFFPGFFKGGRRPLSRSLDWVMAYNSDKFSKVKCQFSVLHIRNMDFFLPLSYSSSLREKVDISRLSFWDVNACVLSG